ncbi:sigma-54-dependent transcriptional regulator [Methylobacterium nonmethylotrophicum]|uniref:Sigma-54-dependent Fis family transcriptional regulator n=1 Tax=Methylobacterium nonmethylotrophicum TaxID=1141884 RepID=A0A4Z0NGG5_9HYPH|nr:sigma-54 dependent transcriptional regulator [Methylobacterium nonmethylotrophicum]TGD94563.1 sigma-54-dependent Fis family transcriptional regulator [Methylobacterium nonmethylotrophicum]
MSLEGRTIALVEDDPIMGESLVDRLTLEGAAVQWWRTCREAYRGLKATPVDLVVCDMRLPDGTGEDVLKAGGDAAETPPFLFVTAFGDLDQAVRLMRQGAGDYLTKPFEMATFLARARQLLRRPVIIEEGALGVSPEMQAVERFLRRVAKVTSPVLLLGETGAGKEVSARFLHSLTEPRPGPLIAVNCAAIPKDLMESELFGHERGAFTGAGGRHRGYAERAGNGILFLDEIGELDIKLQAKLLRLLEDRAFNRVGGEEAVPFRARLVCATNADLEARIRSGTFREDLLYRINVLQVCIPPLRGRGDDIEWLAGRFFASFAEAQQSELQGLAVTAIDVLRGHDWPGNVRELRNRIERATTLSLGPWIMPGDLFPERKAAQSSSREPDMTLGAARDEAEKRQILRALQHSNGGVSAAASTLGISRTTLWEKMRRYRIEAPPEA